LDALATDGLGLQFLEQQHITGKYSTMKKAATMATHSPEYSDDEFDFDEEYFSRTYQPLSNLPTPPPSSRESLAGQSSGALLEDGGLLDSALLGMSPPFYLLARFYLTNTSPQAQLFTWSTSSPRQHL
jgi:hypothetical protein